MRFHPRFTLSVLLLGLALAPALASAESGESYGVALLGFETQDPELQELAAQLPELVAAHLSAAPEFVLVERERLDAALGELELGLSGTIRPESAARLGQIVGAKVLVSCKVFFLGNELTTTARLIGTETSRVFVEKVSLEAGRPQSELAEALGARIAAVLDQRRGALLAQAEPADDRMARLTKLVHGKKLPSVSIAIDERHGGRPALDPAARTEIALMLQQLGFRLLEAGEHSRSADVRITGEAISEVGLHRKNLVSASGRVEIQAVDSSSREVIAVDRQTELAVDLSGTMAGKKALQRASASLAERLVVALLAR